MGRKHATQVMGYLDKHTYKLFLGMVACTDNVSRSRMLSRIVREYFSKINESEKEMFLRKHDQLKNVTQQETA